MAITPVTAWGRLRFSYTAMNQPHVVSFYCREVTLNGQDWVVQGTGANSVQAVVNQLGERIAFCFPNTQGNSIGEAVLETLQPDGSYLYVSAFVPDFGTIVQSGASTFPQPFNQATFVFRDSASKIFKFALFGQGIYSAGAIRSLAGLGGPLTAYRALVDYLTSADAVNLVSRGNRPIQTFKSAAWDSNERLRKEYGFV